MATDAVISTRILHVSLAVEDLDHSLDFYRAAFGARVILDTRGMTELIQSTTGLPGISCDLAQLGFGDEAPLLELIAFRDVPAARADEAPVRIGHGHVCLATPDLDTALARARALGARSLGEVVAYPDGRSVYLREPGGSVLELEEVSP